MKKELEIGNVVRIDWEDAVQAVGDYEFFRRGEMRHVYGVVVFVSDEAVVIANVLDEGKSEKENTFWTIPLGIIKNVEVFGKDKSEFLRRMEERREM